jgi:hypothetical protein
MWGPYMRDDGTEGTEFVEGEDVRVSHITGIWGPFPRGICRLVAQGLTFEIQGKALVA